MAKSLPYLALQNFRYGLDTRRSELTSQPGTLMRGVDCHINQGAEIEKRKAWVKAVSSGTTSALPSGTFGLLPTPNGLMTFGSATQASLFPSGVPAPFLYQQLIDPDIGYSTFAANAIGTDSTGQYYFQINGGDYTSYFYEGQLIQVSGITSTFSGGFLYNGTNVVFLAIYSGGNTLVTIAQYSSYPNQNVAQSPAGTIVLSSTGGASMTSVKAACLFNGLPFVVAYFGSDYGVFYNGSLVNDFFNGEVFSNATSNANLAVQLTNYINTTAGYSATVNGTTVTATSVNSTDSTKLTPGGNFTIVAGNTTAAGVTTVTPISSSVAAYSSESATASFTISAVDPAEGSYIETITLNSAGGINLLSGALTTTGETPTAVATAVATNINSTAAITGISAQSNGGTVTLTLPAGAQYNDSIIVIGVSGAICIENCYFFIDVGSTASDFTISSITPAGGSNILSTSVAGSTNSAETARVLSNNINNYTSTSGYTSCVGVTIGSSTSIYISLATVQTNTASPVNITVTYTNTGGNTGSVSPAATNSGFSAAVTPAAIGDSGATLGTGGIATTSATAKAIGGSGKYTYAWSYYSGSTSIKVLSPTKATTAFQADVAITYGRTASGAIGPNIALSTAGTVVSAKFVCTITDTGQSPEVVAITPPVTVTVTYVSLSGST